MSQPASSLAISSQRILTPDGIRAGTIVIEKGRISSIQELDEGTPGNMEHLDAGNFVIMPGLIDSHVHVNEPGRTEWEGFVTATHAAAAGGITTIADMPLNSNPVTTSVASLEAKLASSKGKMWVDCTFYGGVIPGNEGSLDALINAGVSGFKCFLIHSGIDDFPNVSQEDLEKAMPILASRNVPLLVHAELETCSGAPWNNKSSYQEFLHSRPRRWENDAIDLMIHLARKTGCRVHIVHLSSADAIEAIESARQEGLPISCETCPHYLSFDAEHIPDADTRYKCAPPIREMGNCERLWQGLKEGTIDFIVSDHSPCTPELKFLDDGDLQSAWGGISSLQFGLPAIWTQARKRGFTLLDVSGWMSLNPSKFLNLSHRKGQISQGYDADLVIFDPEEQFVVNASIIQHRHKVTPYENKHLTGVVKDTLLSGTRVFSNGQFSQKPQGNVLLNKAMGACK